MNPSKAWNAKLEAGIFWPSKNLYKQCVLWIFFERNVRQHHLIEVTLYFSSPTHLHFLHISSSTLTLLPCICTRINRDLDFLFWDSKFRPEMSKIDQKKYHQLPHFQLLLLGLGRKLHNSSKVIYLKYSKHLLSTVAHTIDCVCSKILNHGLNHGLLFLLF